MFVNKKTMSEAVLDGYFHTYSTLVMEFFKLYIPILSILTAFEKHLLFGFLVEQV